MNRWAALLFVVVLVGSLDTHLRADDESQNADSTQGADNTPSHHHYELDQTTREHAKPVQDSVVNVEKRTQEKLLEAINKKLTLSQDQQAAMQSAFQEQGTRVDSALREFLDKIKAIEEDKDKKVLAALTDDQKKEYPAIKDEVQKEQDSQPSRNGSGGRRHGGHGGMGGGSWSGGGTGE